MKENDHDENSQVINHIIVEIRQDPSLGMIHT